MSKIGVNRLTEFQAKEYTSNSFKPPGILINAVSETMTVTYYKGNLHNYNIFMKDSTFNLACMLKGSDEKC